MLKFGNSFQTQPSECNEAEDPYVGLTLGWCGKCRVLLFIEHILFCSHSSNATNPPSDFSQWFFLLLKVSVLFLRHFYILTWL